MAAAFAETQHLLPTFRAHGCRPVNTSECRKRFSPHVLSHLRICISSHSFSTRRKLLCILAQTEAVIPGGGDYLWHTGYKSLRFSASQVPGCTPLSTSLNHEQTLGQNWGIPTPKQNGARHPEHSQEMSKSSDQATAKHMLTKS